MSPTSTHVKLRQAHRRLGDLCEISNLFARFDNIEHTLDPALGLAARTLPVWSAVLLETEAGLSKMIVWPSEGLTGERLQAAKEHATAAHAYLVASASNGPREVQEVLGTTQLPRQTASEGAPDPFIVIPLVVAHRRPFGILQLEGAHPFDESDLMFVNAIANQLAIAMSRDRAWRLDIRRRERAEVRQTDAENKGATAERDRATARRSSDIYETLASENARLYGQAQQAVHVREQILAVVSHDLKNPLATILMTAGTLEKRGTSPLPVARIQRSAQRMLRMIEDLLDFASIESGRLAIRCQAQDAASIVQETLASFEGQAAERELQLTAALSPELPKIYCDRDRLLQVLSNLVGNATKAVPAGGSITLSVAARAGELLFVVSDNGMGISAEDILRLFERYWRGDESLHKGAGLGLAISRGIINAHGGRIWVESELGNGASFLFTIPTIDETALFVDHPLLA